MCPQSPTWDRFNLSEMSFTGLYYDCICLGKICVCHEIGGHNAFQSEFHHLFVDPDHRLANSCSSPKCPRTRRSNTTEKQNHVSTLFESEEKGRKCMDHGQNVNYTSVTNEQYSSHSLIVITGFKVLGSLLQGLSKTRGSGRMDFVRTQSICSWWRPTR